MKTFATFDIETDPFKAGRFPQPFACDFFDGKRHTTFWGEDCIERIWPIMAKFKGYIYAHNGGKFDFKYLLPHLPPNDCTVKMIKSRIAKIKFRDAEFRDSYLMLPTRLADYGKTDIDYHKLESDVRDANREEIIRYLKDDTENLYKMVEEFVSEYGFGLTLAGRTFAQLKKRFKIDPPRCNEYYDKQYRKYYYGGRVEFFELGQLKGTFKLYDINSAYPAAMKSAHTFARDFISINVLPKSEKILQTCFISFIGESKGGLPWKNEESALSFKPHVGEFHVTGWELVAARKLGLVRIEKVLTCHRPLSLQNFSDFVDYFYAKKKNAETKGDKLFAKLLLNSCYGKFATDPASYTETKLTDYDSEPDENIEWHKKATAIVEPERHRDETMEETIDRMHAANSWPEKTPTREPWRLVNSFPDLGISVWEAPVPLKGNDYYNVCTAASITGHVRAFLMESLASVKRPVYCDTDCIVCEDSNSLKIGAELGQWKLEGETEKDGLYIAGKKLYAAKLKDGKWKTAAKGVKVSPTQICSIAKGEAVTMTFEAPSFSLLSGEQFITRTVRRDDLRTRRKTKAKK